MTVHRPWSVTERCAVGGGACDLVHYADFPDRTGLVGPMTVKRCRRCGVGVTSPPIADVAFLYSDRTSHDFQPDTGGLSRLIKRVAFKRQAGAMLRQVGMQPERIVDFGCGSGLFTACLAETAAKGTAVLATDFHPVAPRELGDTPYRPMAELDQLAGTADLLIAMHVLEHDDDSLKLLERMIALVRPCGRLLIEVPNVDCAWVSVFGRHWDAWYLPYHRVHFSRPSLRALIARSGLKLVDEYDAAVPTMGRTLANMLGMRNGPIFVLLSAALHPLQLLVERLTGRPSALRVLAEKV